MGRLRERMEQDLRLKNLSPATRKNYSCYARKFAAHFRCSPEEMGETEVREFLLHALQIEQVSNETYRQILAALKFLYTVTLEREWEVERIPFPKRGPRRLPQVTEVPEKKLLERILEWFGLDVIHCPHCGATLQQHPLPHATQQPAVDSLGNLATAVLILDSS